MNTDPLVKSIIDFLDHLKASEKEEESHQIIVNDPIQIFPAICKIQDEINKLLDSSITGRVYSIYYDCVAEVVDPENINLEQLGTRLCGAHHWQPFDVPATHVIGIAASFACRENTQASYRGKLAAEIHKGWNYAELYYSPPSQE
jgi:hypothetical protein